METKHSSIYHLPNDELGAANVKMVFHDQPVSWQFQVGVFLFGLLLKLRKSDVSKDDQTYITKKRTSEERSTRFFKPITPIRCEPVQVNTCPSEWISSELSTDNQAKTILYLHGGSFTGGSIATHRSLCGNIAHFARARVLSIDYRMAPEHPFPAALDDSVAAYRWLLDNGTKPDRIVIAGDSSGGGIALSALAVLRDSHTPLPQAAVCLSAITDLSCTSPTWDAHASNEVVTTVASARRSIKMYLLGTDPHNPLASPLYADLTGLPPIFLQVGSKEVMLDDAVQFALRAGKAGVDVTLDIWPGMIHSWQLAAQFVPEARAALTAIGEFIRSN